MFLNKTIGVIAAAALLTVSSTFGAESTAAPLTLLSRTLVPGFEGDFDHFGVDLKGGRLFLAGEDKGTVEIFDLKTAKHLKTLSGFDAPHAIHYIPESNRLIVSDSGDSKSKVIDGKSYKVLSTLDLIPGADVMKYDPSTREVWIVTGGKNASKKLPSTFVSMVDAASGQLKGQIEFDTDFTEAIAFEQKGNRAFVNVSGKNYVAVIDKVSQKVISTWSIKEGESNAPIALDEENKRLFVVTRKPFKLVVLNTENGQTVASLPAPLRTNEIAYDHLNKRLYMTGDDFVSVVQQRNADQYEVLAQVSSDKGAKTAILIPELNRLFVAVAGSDKAKASVLQYKVTPNSN